MEVGVAGFGRMGHFLLSPCCDSSGCDELARLHAGFQKNNPMMPRSGDYVEEANTKIKVKSAQLQGGFYSPYDLTKVSLVYIVSPHAPPTDVKRRL